MTPPPAPGSADVELVGLHRSYDGTPAVAGASLRLQPGGLTALLGASGCGKTTLLHLVAGLLDPDAGDVRVDGRSVLALPAERRSCAVVFQRPLLFPHLSVAGNVAYGLRARRVGRRERARRVAGALDLVQLAGFGDRRVHELSGGQAQRVAVARALVTEPRVLLLDEPFSQLDAGLREQVRGTLRRVQRQLGVTTLFVTHDQLEAVELGDRVALMVDGRVEQCGPPRELYERPASLAAARFFGAVVVGPGVVRGGAVDCALGRVALGHPVPDGPAVLVVRPEGLQLTDGHPSDRPGPAGTDLAGCVTGVDYRGTHQLVAVSVPAPGAPGGAVPLRVTAPASAAVAVGDRTGVRLPASACAAVPAG